MGKQVVPFKPFSISDLENFVDDEQEGIESDHWEDILVEKAAEVVDCHIGNEVLVLPNNDMLDLYSSDSKVKTENSDSEFEDDVRLGFDHRECFKVPDFAQGIIFEWGFNVICMNLLYYVV